MINFEMFKIYDNVFEFAMNELSQLNNYTNCYKNLCETQKHDDFNTNIYVLNVQIITNILNLINDEYNNNVKIARFDDCFDIILINDENYCYVFSYYIDDENANIYYDDVIVYDNFECYLQNEINTYK